MKNIMILTGAGVSPSHASIETILNVDLVGTAILLEEVEKVIVEGGVDVTISSQSGYRMPALTAFEDEQLATTADEVANVAELLMSDKADVITASTFLCDGGTTTSYLYGE